MGGGRASVKDARNSSSILWCVSSRDGLSILSRSTSVAEDSADAPTCAGTTTTRRK